MEDPNPTIETGHGFLSDLEATLCTQRSEKEHRVVYETVAELHSLVPLQEKVINNEIVAVELCVVSVTPFSKGWHYELTNKIAAGDVFSVVKDKLSSLQGQYLEKFLFHLTVWQPPKRRRDDKTIPPGTLLFSDAVTGFSLYKFKHQGEATHDSIMKIEKRATPNAEKLGEKKGRHM
ncbi:hypothetical protein ATCC90586_001460 [Pythium insidiosum]|nr:hypothetical protein ATCC90586_001460 [Pythium insidiosum]